MTGTLVSKVSITLFFVSVPTMAVSAGEWTHERDVVYGYKDGMALVMDVFTPNVNRNGAGVIRMMSGGMSSSPLWSHVVTQHRFHFGNIGNDQPCHSGQIPGESSFLHLFQDQRLERHTLNAVLGVFRYDKH